MKRGCLTIVMAVVYVAVVQAHGQERRGADGNRATETWIEDAQKLADRVSRERFPESLAMMADWDSNYLRLVMNNQIMPVLPESLDWILRGRRYGKLVEEVMAKGGEEHVPTILAQLTKDAAAWKILQAAGKRVTDNQRLSAPGEKGETFPTPLMYRMNASVLLLGQRPSGAGLAGVMTYVDALGEDVNWAAAGFAARRCIESLPRESLNKGQAEVLTRYDQWKQGETPGRFTQDRELTLPDYRSPIRPGDLATISIPAGGVQVTPPLQTITVYAPRPYTVAVQSATASIYLDISKGGTATAMQAVGFASELFDTGVGK